MNTLMSLNPGSLLFNKNLNALATSEDCCCCASGCYTNISGGGGPPVYLTMKWYNPGIYPYNGPFLSQSCNASGSYFFWKSQDAILLYRQLSSVPYEWSYDTDHPVTSSCSNSGNFLPNANLLLSCDGSNWTLQLGLPGPPNFPPWVMPDLPFSSYTQKVPCGNGQFTTTFNLEDGGIFEIEGFY